MSRQSATRAECSPSPRFSSETAAVLTRSTSCGASVAVRFSRSIWRCFFSDTAGAAGAGAGDRRLVVDGDAEVGGEPGQAAGPALPDRSQPPLPGAPVELADEHRRLGGGTGDLVGADAAAGGVEHVEHQAGDGGEGAAVGRGDQGDPVDPGGEGGEVDLEHLGAGAVTPDVPDGAAGVARGVVEDHVPVVAHPPGAGDEQGGGVDRDRPGPGPEQDPQRG